MEKAIVIAGALVYSAGFLIYALLCLQQGRIYRTGDLDRPSLNQMHRHTLWTALLCFGMLAITASMPWFRIYLGIPSLVMLLGILPLRTVFIEMGFRYNRNGKPRNDG